jgi:hypothetical protein
VVDTGPDIASAGSGAVATASADGGAVAIGDGNSGGNAGNAIGVDDTYGDVPVDPQGYGGNVANSTQINVSVDGGTAIGDATGGDNHLVDVIRRRAGGGYRSSWPHCRSHDVRPQPFCVAVT